MPIPAARGVGVNDAGTLTIVVLPAQAPWPASRGAHEGRELEMRDPSQVKRYTERAKVRSEHQWEIRQA